MCGRFSQYIPKKEIARVFDYDGLFDLAPRYNIAPTQPVAVRQTKDGKRKLAMLRWGLIPAWATDLSIASKTFNARAETIRVKPSFRDAFLRRRCLIPASGFYEWDRQHQPAADWGGFDLVV
jgi:putative SOS response-associated peptidase YedK